MSNVRAGQPGATRLCPHCKATVLESATVCPGCRHHLRFNGGKQLAVEAYTSFSIDGTIAHRQRDEPCEYCIVLQVANERGEQILRQVVGVGALQAGEQRRLNVTVDMLPLVVAAQPRPAVAPRSATGATPAAVAAATPATATPAAAAAATAVSPATAAASPAAPSAATRSAARPAAASTTGTPAAGTSGTTATGLAAAVPAATGATAAGPTSTVRPVVKPATPTRPAPAAPSARSAGGAVPGPGAAPGVTKNPGAPDPGATLGQRLRIFRKP